ncbi:recombinase family protein [Rhodomicrobium vannielii ATCC 17100]|uniref:recombinase family protein n=1 Tax=Rhodomicrobium vannielii TaxID=1069 RepID=UPI00191822AA|nr:recombinase family protein [Rhodomicrobium vannielii]MBJ7535395.1 recombinase family protein [Rhodomicrobium vannielii ATCC 17100]
MTSFLGYIRVSTQKQGQTGVSLQEQRAAIERYARINQLKISRWYEERATAAKRGRPIFTQMLQLLKTGSAGGVIMHKIDRSARNLRDWTELGELIDIGIEVRFATESLDLQTRGGRLSADIQAVVAADYIRNLREEARKGFYGRLNQGVYPLPAPAGYRDEGAGNPKSIDPRQSQIIRELFELYATGLHTLDSLTRKAETLGLKNRHGQAFSKSGIGTLLNNPFYTGLIKIGRTGETFRGSHEPLISTELFEHVQAVLRGKTFARVRSHDFVYRRMLRCARCGRLLTGELQKGRIYYRCHADRGNSLREDQADEQVQKVFSSFQLSGDELAIACESLEYLDATNGSRDVKMMAALNLRLDSIKARYERLLDAYVDHMILKEDFEFRKEKLLSEELIIKGKIAELSSDPGGPIRRLRQEFELAKNAWLSYVSAPVVEKRHLLQRVSSNRLVDQKRLAITLHSPFRQIANRPKIADSGPYRDRFRTFLTDLVDLMPKHPHPNLLSDNGNDHVEEAA